MQIAVSGPAGAGTSTTSEDVASSIGLEYICAGHLFRNMASNEGMTLEEFSEYAEKNPEIDKKIDEEQRRISKEKDNILIEGRLAGWMAERADIKIWLKAPLELRAKRVARREDIGFERALDDIIDREESEKKRYREYYGIDISDLSIYDLIIDTETWKQHEVVGIIGCAVENYEKSPKNIDAKKK